jgi:hypothetical protein
LPPTDYFATALTLALTAVWGLVAVVFAVKLGVRAAAPPRRVWVWAGPVLVGGVAVLAALSLVHQSVRLANAPPPRWTPPPPPPQDLTQTGEWKEWRGKVHDALSTDQPLTPEQSDRLAIDALRLKAPGLSDPYTPADLLRRDLAVADALLSYKPVKELFRVRFGIRDNFLGTGLSQPLGSTPYGAASVHEFLIPNLPETHEHVWTWKFTTLGGNVSLPLKTVIGGTEKDRTPPTVQKASANKFEDDLKEIRLRAENPEHPIPPMIRFARFNEKFYKNTVGRPEAQRVFFSNLSEVWNLNIQQAAEKSGYYYRGDGDTLFMWVYIPYQSNEFTPATWRDIFSKLPEWLDEAPR